MAASTQSEPNITCRIIVSGPRELRDLFEQHVKDEYHTLERVSSSDTTTTTYVLRSLFTMTEWSLFLTNKLRFKDTDVTCYWADRKHNSFGKWSYLDQYYKKTSATTPPPVNGTQHPDLQRWIQKYGLEN